MNDKEMQGTIVKAFLRDFKRMCQAHPDCCNGCPFYGKGCDLLNPLIWDRAIEETAKWAAEHPEETLEPVGDGIYFDPKHRIVADEVVRVYTLEWSVVDGCELTQEQLKEAGKNVASNIKRMRVTYADDVKCVKVQQFIAKCHEEEV